MGVCEVTTLLLVGVYKNVQSGITWAVQRFVLKRRHFAVRGGGDNKGVLAQDYRIVLIYFCDIISRRSVVSGWGEVGEL